MMKSPIRIIVADDERPAREFLKSVLARFANVELVGEAEGGTDAISLIRKSRPDLALLDLKMPEVSGLDVVRLLERDELPMIAFVTAHDDFAVEAFELNAIDYLLKPVDEQRMAITISRAAARLEKPSWRATEHKNLNRAVTEYEGRARMPLERIPVRSRDEIVLVPVSEVASIVADGELLHIITSQNRKFVINHRLKDIERRLDTSKFLRISRGSLVNLDFVTRISPMPGGTYSIALSNGQTLDSSRERSKLLRDQVLKI